MSVIERDPNCIFCKIAAGEIPVEFEYEDDEVVAFKDINPQAPIHLLIIPRLHIPRAGDIPQDRGSLLGRMANAAKELAMKHNVYDEGYRMVINSGDNGGQTVYHLHMHFLAGRFMKWPPG